MCAVLVERVLERHLVGVDLGAEPDLEPEMEEPVPTTRTLVVPGDRHRRASHVESTKAWARVGCDAMSDRVGLADYAVPVLEAVAAQVRVRTSDPRQEPRRFPFDEADIPVLLDRQDVSREESAPPHLLVVEHGEIVEGWIDGVRKLLDHHNFLLQRWLAMAGYARTTAFVPFQHNITTL